MAGSQEYDVNVRAEMDYPEHEKTYALFLTMFKYGVIVCAAVLIFMAIFLL